MQRIVAIFDFTIESNTIDFSSSLQCGPHLWFISTTFQLHILFYPVILLLLRGQIKSALAVSLVYRVIGAAVFFGTILLGIGGIPRFSYVDKTDLA